MRRLFLGLMLAMMSLHLGAVFMLSSIRNQGPRHNLRLTSTRGALVLFGRNSVDMSVYKLFDTWEALESHFAIHHMSLPAVIEVAGLPPAYIQVEPSERKILWSRNGEDRYVIHTPDSESARVFGEYVYYHGLENSHLGFSLPISQATP